MFSIRVISLMLIIGLLDGISTQKSTEIESKMEKLIGTLKSMADRYSDKSKNAIIIENWLQKSLSDLKKQCKEKNEDHLEEKLEHYNQALLNITSLNRKQNHISAYYHVMVVNLWEKMLDLVSYTVQNCLEESGFHWNVNDKFFLMSKLLSEIAKRMSSESTQNSIWLRAQRIPKWQVVGPITCEVSHLTDEDYACSDRSSPAIWACKEALEFRIEEPLFNVLLGELKPSFGGCEENLEIKKCILGIYKKCGKRFLNVYKMMLSPPWFALPCKNFDDL